MRRYGVPCAAMRCIVAQCFVMSSICVKWLRPVIKLTLWHKPKTQPEPIPFPCVRSAAPPARDSYLAEGTPLDALKQSDGTLGQFLSKKPSWPDEGAPNVTLSFRAGTMNAATRVPSSQSAGEESQPP